MPGPGPIGLQAHAVAMRILPALHQQMAQGQQPDAARAIEQDPVAQRLAGAQGREHFNQSPGSREVGQVHRLGGLPNLHSSVRPALERASVGEAQDHAIGVGKASTPALGGARPATDDPMQAVRSVTGSQMHQAQRPAPAIKAQVQEQTRPRGAADIQAQASLGAQTVGSPAPASGANILNDI